MNIQKFSGTNEAGSNSRLVGHTCDALAHFSLALTSGSLVLVDIQGEIYAVIYSPPNLQLYSPQELLFGTQPMGLTNLQPWFFSI